MEQEVESLVPVSNDYLYRHSIAEMGENAKWQDGGDRTLANSIFKSIELHTCYVISFNSKVAGKYEALYKEYILF